MDVTKKVDTDRAWKQFKHTNLIQSTNAFEAWKKKLVLAIKESSMCTRVIFSLSLSLCDFSPSNAASLSPSLSALSPLRSSIFSTSHSPTRWSSSHDYPLTPTHIPPSYLAGAVLRFGVWDCATAHPCSALGRGAHLVNTQAYNMRKKTCHAS